MMDFKSLVQKHGINITGVLHLGASYGQEASLYNEVTDGEVLWVEAIPTVFEQLRENIKPYPKQTAIKACLSNIDGQEVVFHISNNESQSSSMLELGEHLHIHPEVSYIDQIKLVTTRVDTLFNLLGRDGSGLDFLSVDLQGVEYQAIDGVGNLLNNFKWCLVEVNKKETYVGCMLIDDFDYFMLQKGFERVETGDWVAESWTDALYKRIFNIP